MSDPWNAAWEEAEASVNPAKVIYSTIELRHPSFVSGGTPFALRAVNDIEERTFTLEDGAVLQGGQAVVFAPTYFTADIPEYGEGRLPESRLTIDNVVRELEPYIQDAAMEKADLVVVFRQYHQDDTTAPCYGPVEFVMRKVKVSGTTIEGYARLDDLANKRFPSRVYSRNEFPSLI